MILASQILARSWLSAHLSQRLQQTVITQPHLDGLGFVASNDESSSEYTRLPYLSAASILSFRAEKRTHWFVFGKSNHVLID
jgi:hypothetical protein